MNHFISPRKERYWIQFDDGSIYVTTDLTEILRYARFEYKWKRSVVIFVDGNEVARTTVQTLT